MKTFACLRVIGDHLLRPRVADVAADDRQLGEVDRDLVDVRDRPADLGRLQRAGVADLRAEGDAELHAGGVERVEAAVGRRGLPQPREHAQAAEALLDAGAQLAHRLHRLGEVDRGEPDEAIRVRLDVRGDLVVGDQRALRTVPGGQDGLRRRRPRPSPPASTSMSTSRDRAAVHQRSSEASQVLLEEARRRVLRPGVDHHNARRPASALPRVTSSAYSRSAPTGRPEARRVTVTSRSRSASAM